MPICYQPASVEFEKKYVVVISVMHFFFGDCNFVITKWYYCTVFIFHAKGVIKVNF